MSNLPLRPPFFESQDLSLPMSPLGRFLFDQHLIPGEHQLFDLLHGQQPVDGCPLVLGLTSCGVKQVVVELLKPPQRYGVRGNDLYKVAVHRTSSFVLSCQYNPASIAMTLIKWSRYRPRTPRGSLRRIGGTRTPSGPGPP